MRRAVGRARRRDVCGTQAGARVVVLLAMEVARGRAVRSWRRRVVDIVAAVECDVMRCVVMCLKFELSV